MCTKIAPQHNIPEFIRYVKSAEKKNSEKKLRSPLFSNFRFQSKWNNEHECICVYTSHDVLCMLSPSGAWLADVKEKSKNLVQKRSNSSNFFN